MPARQLVEVTERRIRERGFTTLRSTPQSGLYLFFSFDLVNSTQFKASHPGIWPVVVRRFYEFVENAFSTRLELVKLWKFVGDEILFFKKAQKIQDLGQCLDAACEALNAAEALLHQIDSAAREMLSVKATAWVAPAQYLPPSSSEKVNLEERNIIVKTGSLPDSGDTDFLGPDVDAGFRISKFTQRRRLVVSAHLAWLLYRKRENWSDIEKSLRIVGYETLKGVWAGRPYPIFWYEANWEKAVESFPYDEHLSSEFVQHVKERVAPTSSEPQPEWRLSRVEKIFHDLGKMHECERMLELLSSMPATSDDDGVTIEIPRDRYAELHCVAVCFSPTGKVLIGKRPNTKRRLSGAFEFGCGQLRLGESFRDCLRRAYKQDFGADLEFDGDPIPVRTFTLSDASEQREIPGIIFVAEVQNPDAVQAAFLKAKHSEIRWIDPASFTPGDGTQYVPGFEQSLKLAHTAWLLWKGPRANLEN